MNTKKEMIEKLSQYGLTASQQSQRSLQEKIIQMYELLEIKTTQNLLLRKQNDDIKLQIQTIQEVFTNAENNIKENNNQIPNNILPLKNCSEKINNFQFNQKTNQSKKCTNGPSQIEIKLEANARNNQFMKDYQNSQQEYFENEQATPRISSKPYRNSRFCSNQKTTDKQPTSRMCVDYKSQFLKKNNLNQKIEMLMKQNETILKRMNQIEVNFINKSQQQQQNVKFHKNYDDRSTHFSSNITSIQNIWAKKQNQSNFRGLSSHNRAHYSTSNLKSYCPSVD